MKFKDYLLQEMADHRTDVIGWIGSDKEQYHLHMIKALRHEWNERDTQTHIDDVVDMWAYPFSNYLLKGNKRLKLRDYQSILRITRSEYDNYIKKHFTNSYLDYNPRFDNEDEAFDFVYNSIEDAMVKMADGTIRNNKESYRKYLEEITGKP